MHRKHTAREHKRDRNTMQGYIEENNKLESGARNDNKDGYDGITHDDFIPILIENMDTQLEFGAILGNKDGYYSTNIFQHIGYDSDWDDYESIPDLEPKYNSDSDFDSDHEDENPLLEKNKKLDNRYGSDSDDDESIPG